jgi:hypothetical protein
MDHARPRLSAARQKSRYQASRLAPYDMDFAQSLD